MTISARTRRALYRKLTDVLGTEHAEALIDEMSRTDLATKDDLARLEARLDARFEAIDARFEAIDARFEAIDAHFDAIDGRFQSVDGRLHEQSVATHELAANLYRELAAHTRTIVFACVGSILTAGGAAFAAGVAA